MKEIVTYSAAENQLYLDVKTIIEDARANAVRSVDYNRVLMYWKTGRRVFEEEQRGAERSDYVSYLIERLAQRLEPGYGSGFSKRQLHFSVQFYRTYPKVNALRSQLNWTQYRTLIQISDPDIASKYELYLPTTEQLVDQVEEGKREYDRMKQQEAEQNAPEG